PASSSDAGGSGAHHPTGTPAAGAALGRSSVTAAHPVVPREVALQTGLQWPERTGGVGESHLLTPRTGVRRRVFPIEPGAAGDVVLALVERRGRRVDRPERGDGGAPRVPQAGEIAGRGALQLRQRARV